MGANMAQSTEHKNRPAMTPASEADSSSDVIDLAASLRRMGNNRELFAEVVAIYDEDSPQLLERIRRAIHNGDAAGLHRAAHSMKGLVANFGAGPAAEAAYALETMGTRRDLDGSEGALRALEHELDRLNHVLEPFERIAPP
jgi:HPt (histidine-containing phosphotransfer) domain-containing protein